VYESVWKDNRRRHDRVPTVEVMRKYGHDYKLILVGDASMSPYELEQPGGSVEHWNDEPGRECLERILRAWPRAAWLNPVPEEHWGWTTSIQNVQRIMGGRMHPGNDRTGLSGRDEVSRRLRCSQPHPAPARRSRRDAIDRDVEARALWEVRERSPFAHPVRSTPASRRTLPSPGPRGAIDSGPGEGKRAGSRFSKRPGARAARCTTSRAQTCRGHSPNTMEQISLDDCFHQRRPAGAPTDSPQRSVMPSRGAGAPVAGRRATENALVR
jgi:hypothetical protein